MGRYEKGMIHVTQLPIQCDKDKKGHGFKGPQTIITTTQIHEIEDEEDYEGIASPHEDLLCEASSSPMFQCFIAPYLFK